jgi:hypothetical protein
MPGGAIAIASNHAGFDYERAKCGLQDLAGPMHRSDPDLPRRTRHLDASRPPAGLALWRPDRTINASKGSVP